MTLSGDTIRLFYDLWDETRTGREYVTSNVPAESVDKVPRSNAREVHHALTYFNRIGHLIAQGAFDEKFVTSLVGKEVIRAGERMRPFLADERTKRKDPEYQRYAEELIDRCHRAHPDYQPTYSEEEHHREERPAFGLRP